MWPYVILFLFVAVIVAITAAAYLLWQRR